jgi:site-specific recombinase XerC
VPPHVLRYTFSYAYLEKTHNDLVGLADILGHDNLATTQIYTQKPLGVLQDEIEKVQFF